MDRDCCRSWGDTPACHPNFATTSAVVERLQPRDDLVDEAGCLGGGLPDPDSCGLERLGLGRSRA